MQAHDKQPDKHVTRQLDQEPSNEMPDWWEILGAAMNGELEVLKNLYQANKPITITNEGRKNALHLASQDPKLTNVVAWLLTLTNSSDQSRLFDLEASDQDGFTAVLYAASGNHVAALCALEEAGADIKATKKKRR